MRVLFNDAWADIESAVTTAQRGAGPAKTTRAADDILDEILFRVRRLERRTSTKPSRMGPSGLTRDDEKDLVHQVFEAIDSGDQPGVRGGVKVGASGAVVTISAPSTATVDLDHLQTVADQNDVRIEIVDHGIIVEPRGRYRDPASLNLSSDREDV